MRESVRERKKDEREESLVNTERGSDRRKNKKSDRLAGAVETAGELAKWCNFRKNRKPSGPDQ